MGLGSVFVRSVVREIGRNYGKAASNALLGDKHSTPVRMVGLGAGTATRGYKHKLDKICKTWQVKGPTATFNVAQNMYNAFFDLVDEAKADGVIDFNELGQLMKDYVDFRKQLIRVIQSLRQLDKPELADKVDKFDDQILDFWCEFYDTFNIGPRPSGLFKGKKKKTWDYANSLKNNLQTWVNSYRASLNK